MQKKLLTTAQFAIAAFLYAAFAVYLYQPYFKHFDITQYLYLLNPCLSALGCFILSRRWLSSFGPSFLSGAFCGFGPLMLGLAAYHPLAGFIVALAPWLFYPAAYSVRTKYKWAQAPLSALPFLAIPILIWLTNCCHLFVVPTQTKLQTIDLLGLLSPLIAANKDLNLFGFYHVPISALVIGLSMFIAARRLGIAAIIIAGIVLACTDSVFNVNPMLWLAIPATCCSIIIGAGIQTLISAGFTDRKYILLAMITVLVLSIAALLLATKYSHVFSFFTAQYAKLFLQTAKMYLLAAIAIAVIFFITRAKLRLTPLRAATIYAAIAIDIFYTAQLIVDRIL